MKKRYDSLLKISFGKIRIELKGDDHGLFLEFFWKVKRNEQTLRAKEIPNS